MKCLKHLEDDDDGIMWREDDLTCRSTGCAELSLRVGDTVWKCFRGKVFLIQGFE